MGSPINFFSIGNRRPNFHVCPDFFHPDVFHRLPYSGHGDIASFAKTEGQAGSYATLISVPMAFVIGSLMQLNTELFSRFLPWGQAVHCLRAILNAGAPISLVLPNILWMILETAVLSSKGGELQEGSSFYLSTFQGKLTVEFDRDSQTFAP